MTTGDDGMIDPVRFPYLSRPIVWGPVTNRFVPDPSCDEALVSDVSRCRRPAGCTS
jgi:hypothetical protein